MTPIALGLALSTWLVYRGLTIRAQSGSVASWIHRRFAFERRDMGTVVWAGAMFGCLAFVVVAMLASVEAAVVPAAICAVAPLSIVRSRRARRVRDRREAWPDALGSLIAGVRSGASIAEACDGLADRGPLELRSAFKIFRATYRSTGDIDRAFESLVEALDDPTGDRVVSALRLTHDVGGPELVRVLRTLAGFVRDETRIRREIEARWSWTKTAARIAAGAPWLVFLLMSVRPEAVVAYRSPAGATVLAIGAFATIVGYRLMMLIARLPEEGRLR